MRKKIIGIFVCMLLISTVIPVTVIAESKEDFGIVDEKDEQGCLLPVLKIKESNHLFLKPFSVVDWNYNEINTSGETPFWLLIVMLGLLGVKAVLSIISSGFSALVNFFENLDNLSLILGLIAGGTATAILWINYLIGLLEDENSKFV